MLFYLTKDLSCIVYQESTDTIYDPCLIIILLERPLLGQAGALLELTGLFF